MTLRDRRNEQGDSEWVCRLQVSRLAAYGLRCAVNGIRFTDNGSRIALMAGETPPARRLD